MYMVFIYTFLTTIDLFLIVFSIKDDDRKAY